MVNCPNCHHPVPDNQRFCGNCGSDVSAAQAANPPGTPIGEGQAAPYAYAQPAGYGYEPQSTSDAPRPVAGRMIVMIAVLILAACCAFACGILIGFEASPIVFPSSTPAPTPRPTRESLLPILSALGLA
ncbi:MAG: zinc ribbon domain-containing protein [Chloroflexota bacterium]